MNKKILKVSKRTVLGRKVKKLRKEGILPANIFGKKIKSSSIQISEKDFEKIFHDTGKTGLIELQSDKNNVPVLIHSVTYHPVNEKPLHVNFQQVDLKEKVTARVPIVMTGEPVAIKEKKGSLLTLISELEVEALPSDLPENIKVDISGLSDVNQSIKVQELKIDSKIKILIPPDTEIARIAEIKVEVEQKPEVPQEETGEKPSAEGQEEEKETEKQPEVKPAAKEGK